MCVDFDLSTASSQLHHTASDVPPTYTLHTKPLPPPPHTTIDSGGEPTYWLGEENVSLRAAILYQPLCKEDTMGKDHQ